MKSTLFPWEEVILSQHSVSFATFSFFFFDPLLSFFFFYAAFLPGSLDYYSPSSGSAVVTALPISRWTVCARSPLLFGSGCCVMFYILFSLLWKISAASAVKQLQTEAHCLRVMPLWEKKKKRLDSRIMPSLSCYWIWCDECWDNRAG